MISKTLIVLGIFTFICGVGLIVCGALQLQYHSYKAPIGHGFWTGILLILYAAFTISMSKSEVIHCGICNNNTVSERRECLLIFIFVFVVVYFLIACPVALVMCAHSIYKDNLATRKLNPNWCFDGCCLDIIDCGNMNKTEDFWVNITQRAYWNDWDANQRPKIPCSTKFWKMNCEPNDRARTVVITEIILLVIGFVLLMITTCNLGSFEKKLTKTEPDLLFMSNKKSREQSIQTLDEENGPPEYESPPNYCTTPPIEDERFATCPSDTELKEEEMEEIDMIEDKKEEEEFNEMIEEILEEEKEEAEEEMKEEEEFKEFIEDILEKDEKSGSGDESRSASKSESEHENEELVENGQVEEKKPKKKKKKKKKEKPIEESVETVEEAGNIPPAENETSEVVESRKKSKKRSKKGKNATWKPKLTKPKPFTFDNK